MRVQSIPHPYSKLLAYVRQLPAATCRTRRMNLVWMMLGMLHSRSVHLHHIARRIPVRAKTVSLERRLRRFMDNAAVRVREWYEPQARALLLAASQGGRVHLLIDGSKVARNHKLLMVSVAYRRRSVPLAWTWGRSGQGMSSTRKQLALLGYVQRLLPRGVKVDLVGDCEFNKPDLIRQLQQWGWDYALRQPAHYLIQPGGQATYQRIDTHPLRPGDLHWLGQVTLTRAHPVCTHLVLYWAANQPEPWYLATNLLCPQPALRLYRRRMWIEEMFGDMKKHGFDLEATRLRTILRLSRLTLVVCLLYLWLIALGEYLIRSRQTDLVDRHDRRDLSLFRLGWDFLERCCALGDPLPPVFVPTFCLVSGS